ncbi:MAG: hypothetical protein K6T65_15780 [Peptococcaceae bacterium]|nr:hypothetical protein [Peptococcaceae bacterium]
MTDLQFGLLLTVFGGGLTLISLGFIAITITVLVKFQSRARDGAKG